MDTDGSNTFTKFAVGMLTRVLDNRKTEVVCSMQKDFEKHCSTDTSKKVCYTERIIKNVKFSVFPHFTNCSTVWHDGNASQLNKLYKL